MGFPIATARLVLRPLRQDDLAVLAAYRNHPEVARYQSWSGFSLDDAVALLAGQDALAFDTDASWFQIAVERQADRRLVGDIGVRFFDKGRQAELGVTLAVEAQGRGFAREAVARIVGLLFEEYGKHRLIATADTSNDRVHKLLEQIGFRREAAYRQNIFFKGRWGDEYGYALLASEWRPAIRAVPPPAPST